MQNKKVTPILTIKLHELTSHDHSLQEKRAMDIMRKFKCVVIFDACKAVVDSRTISEVFEIE